MVPDGVGRGETAGVGQFRGVAAGLVIDGPDQPHGQRGTQRLRQRPVWLLAQLAEHRLPVGQTVRRDAGAEPGDGLSRPHRLGLHQRRTGQHVSALHRRQVFGGAAGQDERARRGQLPVDCFQGSGPHRLRQFVEPVQYGQHPAGSQQFVRCPGPVGRILQAGIVQLHPPGKPGDQMLPGWIPGRDRGQHRHEFAAGRIIEQGQDQQHHQAGLPGAGISGDHQPAARQLQQVRPEAGDLIATPGLDRAGVLPVIGHVVPSHPAHPQRAGIKQATRYGLGLPLVSDLPRESTRGLIELGPGRRHL